MTAVKLIALVLGSFLAGFLACLLVDLLVIHGTQMAAWIWAHVVGRNGLDLLWVALCLAIIAWIWSRIDNSEVQP